MEIILLAAGLILLVIGLALGLWHLRRGEAFFSIEINIAEGRYIGAPSIAFIIIGAALIFAAVYFDTQSLEDQLTEKDATIHTLTAQKEGAETARDTANDARDAAIKERDSARAEKNFAEIERTEAAEASRLAIDAMKRSDEARTSAETERDAAKTERDEARQNFLDASKRANMAEANAERAEAAMTELEREFRDTVLLLQRLSLSPGEVEAFTKLRNDIASLNDHLEFISLQPTAGILIEGRERWVTFSIARTDLATEQPDQYTLFAFESRQTSPVDPWGYPPSEQVIGALAANLCEAANLAIFSNIDFWDALAELSDELAEARFKPIIGELAESAYLRLLVAQRFSGAEILIRGYADSATGDWTEPLGARPDRLSVLPLRDPGASDAVFTPARQEIQVGEQTRSGRVFGNADLPNLRAFSVALLVDEMIDQCRDRGAGVSGINILEGAVVPRRDSAYRRAVGYLQVPIP